MYLPSVSVKVQKESNDTLHKIMEKRVDSSGVFTKIRPVRKLIL